GTVWRSAFAATLLAIAAFGISVSFCTDLNSTSRNHVFQPSLTSSMPHFPKFLSTEKTELRAKLKPGIKELLQPFRRPSWPLSRRRRAIFASLALYVLINQ